MKILFDKKMLLSIATVIILGLMGRATSHYHDLTHMFNNNTLQWPSSTQEFEVIQYIYRTYLNKIIQGDRYQGEVHAGTHMDSPVHMVEGKWSINEIPLSRLLNVPGIVVDVSMKTAKDPDYAVSDDDIKDWIREHGPIPEKSVVLFNTGWSKHYSNPKKYFGNPDLDVSALHFPGIDISAAKWLVNHTSIVGIGLDTPSIDCGKAKRYVSHYTFFEENIWGLENLKGLDELPPFGIKLIVAPMNIESASGAPCRVIAAVDHHAQHLKGEGDSNSSVEEFIFLMVVILLASN